MRSFIKFQAPKTTSSTFDVLPFNQLPFKQEDIRHSGAATNNVKSIIKKNSIYNPSVTTKGDFWFEDQQASKRDTRRKKTIQKYINQLTNDMQLSHDRPESYQCKFNALKKIIQYYDIKTMQKTDYSKLIKTFGLQIGPVQNSYNEDRKKIKTHNQSRSFRLRQTSRNNSRLGKIITNKIEDGNSEGQVALLKFSKQLLPKSKQSKRNVSLSEKLTARYPIKTGRKKSVQLTVKQKDGKKKESPSPFKFKSTQDIIIEKLNKYRQFLFILNSSNHLYRNMNFNEYENQLKFFVGGGNNSNLIRSLMAKRYYFVETKNIKQANFIWTQIKVDTIFKKQVNSQALNLQPIVEIKTNRKPNLHHFFKCYQTQQSLLKLISKKQTFKILNLKQKFFNKVVIANKSIEEKLKTLQHQICFKQFKQSDTIHNHLPYNGLLGNKKGMFYCLREYYKITGRNVWDILPLTFHVTKSVDVSFKQFAACFNERKKNKQHNIWIIKPGQFSNRGNGISCSNKLQQIRKRANACHTMKNGEQKSLILQLYINNPLLYNSRKFDIRAYMLVTCHNGKIKGYWYQQGYVRTSSYIFNLSDLADNDIHLTNDAIQKQSDNYGKFQPGNKLSYGQLQRYLLSLPANGRNMNLFEGVLPKMKAIAAEALKSSFLFIDNTKKQNNFEVFGLDFMIDYNLKPWLIQINTNPCLELSCPLLERIIPHMVQNAMRIGLDTIFPPPNTVPHNFKYNIAENALHYNRFQLIFDEQEDGPSVMQLYQSYPESHSFVSSLMNIKQDQQEYKEEGKLCDYDI